MQAGDGATWSFNVATGGDTVGVLIELAGGGGAPVFVVGGGDAVWTAGTHSAPSASIAAAAGGYGMVLFAGWNGSAEGTNSFSNGVTFGASGLLSTSGFPIDYNFGYQTFSTAGTLSTTLTDTHATGLTSPIVNVVLVVSPGGGGTDTASPVDNRATFSDSPVFTIGHTLVVGDTRAAFTDAPGMAIQQNFSASDTRAPFSDAPSFAIAHTINVSDTRAPFSDSPTIAPMIQFLGPTDTRAPFSDVPSFSIFIPGSHPAGNGDNPSGAIGNGGVAGGTTGNGRLGAP